MLSLISWTRLYFRTQMAEIIYLFTKEKFDFNIQSGRLTRELRKGLAEPDFKETAVGPHNRTQKLIKRHST